MVKPPSGAIALKLLDDDASAMFHVSLSETDLEKARTIFSDARRTRISARELLGRLSAAFPPQLVEADAGPRT